MKLCIIFTAILAISLAKTIPENETEDLEAVASMELLKTDKAVNEESLVAEASSYSAASAYSNNYIPPSQRPQKQWNQYQNYVPNNPQNTWNQWNNNNNPFPAPAINYPSVSAAPGNYIPSAPQNDYFPPQNQQSGAHHVHVPNVPAYNPGVVSGSGVQNVPAAPPAHQQQPAAPVGVYRPPVQSDNPVHSAGQVPPSVPVVPANILPPSNPPAAQNPVNPQAPQNDYYTTPQTQVIKNEQHFGDNGSYKYEYQLGDGTWVGEEGYILYPNTEHENVVKKGWYTYTARDGKVYTVSWYADNNGYVAYGDHLPKAPVAPQASQPIRDETVKPSYGTNQPRPTQGTYRPTPAPTYYPQQPQQPTYNNYNNAHWHQ